MCQPFSCILTQQGDTLTHPNPTIHSHEQIIKHFHLQETHNLSSNPWIRIECKPKKEQYHTHPDTWDITIDDYQTPLWYTSDQQSFEQKIRTAATQWWNNHVKDGIHTITELYEDGTIESQITRKNEYLHNQHGPAFLRFHKNGQKHREEYWLNGQKHNLNGPAKIIHSDTGQLEYEEYIQAGQYHRTDGPAYTSYQQNGTIQTQAYYQNNQLHRTYGPAYTDHYQNGQIRSQSFYQHGCLHNPHGPARTTYHPNSTILEEQYHQYGKSSLPNTP